MNADLRCPIHGGLHFVNSVLLLGDLLRNLNERFPNARLVEVNGLSYLKPRKSHESSVMHCSIVITTSITAVWSSFPRIKLLPLP